LKYPSVVDRSARAPG